jgi:predicted small secreted protein
MRRIAVLMMLLGGLGACNTIEGVGADISAGARTVRNAF